MYVRNPQKSFLISGNFFYLGVLHNDMPYDLRSPHQVAKIADFKVYLLRRYACKQQSCSPRDRGLGLETAWDRFFAVLVLVLKVLVFVLDLVSALPVLVFALVSKCRSFLNCFSRPPMYFPNPFHMVACFFLPVTQVTKFLTSQPWSTFSSWLFRLHLVSTQPHVLCASYIRTGGENIQPWRHFHAAPRGGLCNLVFA